MKQKILCSILLTLLGCMPCFANFSLLIHLTDSTEIVCSLAKKPTMTFQDKTITLSSVEGTVGQWDFSDVDSWNFADVKDVNAVNPVNEEGGRSSVTVPDSSDGQISISTDGLPKGTYILKAGNSSIKFLVQ